MTILWMKGEKARSFISESPGSATLTSPIIFFNRLTMDFSLGETANTKNLPLEKQRGKSRDHHLT